MDELKAWLGGIAVLAFGGAFGHAYLKKHFSTSLEIAKDRAEGDIIKHQASRIDMLEGLLSAQTEKYFEAVKASGVLEGEVRALTMKSQMQEMEIRELRSVIATMQAQIETLMARVAA